MKIISQPFSISVSADVVGNPLLAALPANTALDLGPFACTQVDGAIYSSCKAVTRYSGMVYDPARRQMVMFGGGHASTNYDSINCLKMDSLKWVEEYPPTPLTSLVLSNYDVSNGAWISGPSGPYPRAAARHTEDSMTVLGDELIVLTGVEGNMTEGTTISSDHVFDAPAKTSHYNFVSKTWSFSSTALGLENPWDWPGTAYDPVSGLIIKLGENQGLQTYDPTTKTRTNRLSSGFVRDVNGNAISLGDLEYNNNLVYYPPGDCFLYFRSGLGLPNGVFKLTLNRSNYSLSICQQLATTGTPPPTAKEVAARFDSRNQVVGVGPVNNIFYTFDPETLVWSAHTIQGGTPGSVSYHAMDYDPVNNVFIFIADDGATNAGTTWAYRFE